MPANAPKAAQASQTPDMRGQILMAATKLFAAQGFGATSLQAIAEAVGIRKASLLYYFSSKDELRQAVMNELLGRWNQDLPRLLEAASSGSRRFDAVTSEVLTFFTADPDRARLLVREVLDNPESMREVLHTYFSPWTQLASEYIRLGQADGSIYEDLDPEAYVTHVLTLIFTGVAIGDMVSTLLPHGTQRDKRERHLRELERLARDALFARPAKT